MKVIVYSTQIFERDLGERNESGIEFCFTRQRLNEFTASLAEGFKAALLFCCDDASPSIISKLHQGGVRYLIIRNDSHKSVAVDYAMSLGMTVHTCVGLESESIAEHGLALLLCVLRKIRESQVQMAKDDFRLDMLSGTQIAGKTIGFYGLNNRTKLLSQLLSGFACKQLYYDFMAPSGSSDSARMTHVDFDALCQESDVIFITADLGTHNKHLFNRQAFRLMKETAVLINLSHGAIVDSMDLLESLESAEIGFACLDVYEYESDVFFQHHGFIPMQDELFRRLKSLPNALITPHIGFLTREHIQATEKEIMNVLESWQSEAPVIPLNRSYRNLHSR